MLCLGIKFEVEVESKKRILYGRGERNARGKGKEQQSLKMGYL